MYAAISQVDVAGDIPKLIVNAVTAKATADWFQNFEKACVACILIVVLTLESFIRKTTPLTRPR